jgi:hypothetical protein
VEYYPVCPSCVIQWFVMEGGRWERYSSLGDRWLPTPISFSVQSPRRLLWGCQSICAYWPGHEGMEHPFAECDSWRSRKKHGSSQTFLWAHYNQRINWFGVTQQMVSSQFIVHITWRRRCKRSIGLQKIWFRRNSVVHGGIFTHPSHVLWEDTLLKNHILWTVFL